MCLAEAWTSTDTAKFEELCARFDEAQLALAVSPMSLGSRAKGILFGDELVGSGG